MNLLAISGSARSTSTNTALLQTVSKIAPNNIQISVFDGIGHLPVFSPDLENITLPHGVQQFVDAIAAADGLLIASPEYVRSIPGGLKNAIDWLVSGEHIVDKPIALLHASHRGGDMLAQLRLVLSTVSQSFATDLFLRFPLMNKTPQQVEDFFSSAEHRQQVQTYLARYEAFCQATKKPA
ncbi:NADPH-dependent FMN reductase [Cohaesibacter celericrescens]|uniref:NADPH-dependent FMN reductase n=1 Tax=Cohaesibacter celericrescens TaxID=2067669 RepID=UPI0035680604